jgi:Ca2+-binding EF-hand superfamily protein
VLNPFVQNPNGKVPKSNAWLLLRAVGENVLPTTVHTVLGEIPDDGLDSTKFQSVMEERFAQSATREAAEAFAKFDADGNGTIDVHELSTLMKNLGLPLPQNEVRCLTLIALAELSLRAVHNNPRIV